MIIDIILDRYDSEKETGKSDYNPHNFYFDCLNYEQFLDNHEITIAMDYGKEQDVQKALCDYVDRNGYNPLIKDYIKSRTWLEKDHAIHESLVDILA